MKTLLLSTLLLLTLATAEAQATCGLPNGLGDTLARVLAAENQCPRDVFAFREALVAKGAKLETALVANRGFHNPSQGSFSMFEMVTGIAGRGDFFFGHFTATEEGGKLVADQNPGKGSLMIEALAFDARKGFYNFYELRGDGQTGQWFYRGDSADILADNQLLHRQPDPSRPKFGATLRCAGCHQAGGPIMKELSAPHNDWWSVERKLDLGGFTPEPRLAKIFQGLVPADRLAKSVAAGLAKLETSGGYKSVKRERSLQEVLRPLFCPMEVNFESDRAPNGSGAADVQVPSSFLIDPRLARSKLALSRASYERLLSISQSSFPETDLPDADHAWLAPVKALSDRFAVDALIEDGLLDREFAADVLAVDFTNPVFSRTRCGLLKLLPPGPGASGWKAAFASAVKSAAEAGSKSAAELLKNLTDPERTLAFHHARAAKLLEACSAKLATQEGATGLYRLLLQRRLEIAASEISANPRGQILEPGFRVIFPESPKAGKPGALVLGDDCEIQPVSGASRI